MAYQQSASDDDASSRITHDKLVQGAAAAASMAGTSGGPVANFGRCGEQNTKANVFNSYSMQNQSQSFNTTAPRDTCPKVHPYESKADQYSDRLIGPGSYNNLVSSFTHRKTKTLRKDPVGFGATAVRECGENQNGGGNNHGGAMVVDDDNLAIRSKSAPGPDQYNPDYFTIVKQVEKRVVGRNGVFGTTGPRFRQRIDEDLIPRPEGEQFQAGSGSSDDGKLSGSGSVSYLYDEDGNVVEVPSNGGYYPRVKQMIYQSPFEKKKKSPKKQKDGFVVFGNGEVASISKRRIQGVDEAIRGNHGSQAAECEPLWKIHQHHQNKQLNRPNGFNVSAPRGGQAYNIDGSRYNENPGPQYSSKQGFIYKPEKVFVEGSRKGFNSTFSKDRRKFVESSGLTLGPGSYTLPGSFNSKSFNITFKSKKMVYKRKSEDDDDYDDSTQGGGDNTSVSGGIMNVEQ